MNGWFLALIIIELLTLFVYLVEHGKPKEGKYNFWGRLTGVAITVFITYMAIKTGFH